MRIQTTRVWSGSAALLRRQQYRFTAGRQWRLQNLFSGLAHDNCIDWRLGMRKGVPISPLYSKPVHYAY
jgi:hypothetical protein